MPLSKLYKQAARKERPTAKRKNHFLLLANFDIQQKINQQINCKALDETAMILATMRNNRNDRVNFTRVIQHSLIAFSLALNSKASSIRVELGAS